MASATESFSSPINKEAANRRKIDEALARATGAGKKPNGKTSKPSAQPKPKAKPASTKETVYQKGNSYSQHGDSTATKKKY